MAAILIGNWWVLALRGVAAILFAIIAFFWPEISAAALILLFGVYALVDGIFALVAGLRAARRHGRTTALLVEGILNIVIAVIVFVWPGPALVALIYLIALWAIVSGVTLVAAGIAPPAQRQLRRWSAHPLDPLGSFCWCAASGSSRASGWL